MTTFGTQIDIKKDFDILGVLGEGSFGKVFRAKHNQSGNVFALKQQRTVDKNPQLIREIKIMEQMAQKNNPHIVSYFGSVYDKKEAVMWIVMELMCYGSVRDMMSITKNVLNEHQISTICTSALHALVFLCSVEKIHRDMKPHNILVNEKGCAKLCDFGVSSHLPHGQKRKTIIGTPHYLAPEVIEEQLGYDILADVWALGITAIEMAEFRPPLHDAHPMRVLFMIPNNDSPTLTNQEHYSSDFNDFLAQAMQKDPAKRWRPEALLEHPFITKKSSLHTMYPFLKAVATYINQHGGSLDEALKSARNEPVHCDEESPDDHTLSFESSSSGCEEDISSELDFGDGELDGSEESTSEELNLVEPKPKPHVVVPPRVTPQPQKPPTIVIAPLKKALTPAPLSPFRKIKPTLFPQIKKLKLGKIEMDHQDLSELTTKEINVSALMTSRSGESSGDGTPRVMELHDVDTSSLHEETLKRVQKDQLAVQVRADLKRRISTIDASDGPISPKSEFKRCHPSFQQVTQKGFWQGFGTLNNPWRNNQQFTIKLSNPSLIFIQITSEAELPSIIGITILSVRQAQAQTILRPAGAHTIHTWRDQKGPHRTLEVYLEDEEQTYVIVPTISALGYKRVDFSLTILYPGEIKMNLNALNPLPSNSVRGEWTPGTAGGNIETAEWRNNPQYVVQLHNQIAVYLFLAQILHNQTDAEANIGFYIVKVKSYPEKKLIAFDHDNVLMFSIFNKKSEVTPSTKMVLAAGTYVIIPCTAQKQKLSKFELTIASPDVSFPLQLIELDTYWNKTALESKWDEQRCGGCANPNNNEWRNNPMFSLTIEKNETVHFVLDRRQEAKLLVGLYIFKETEGGMATLTKRTLIDKVGFSDKKEVQLSTPLKAFEKYIIVCCTFQPKSLGNFILRLYSEGVHRLKELAPLAQITLTDSWTKECGGIEQWIKNPQFSLQTTAKEKTVQIILEQDIPTTQPKTETPFMGIIGVYDSPQAKKALNLVSISDTKQCFETKFQNYRRIVHTQSIVAGSPLIIVPCTFSPQVQSSFKISVAAESVDNITFNVIKPVYKVYKHSSSWSISKNTALGCRNFCGANFIDNPAILCLASHKGTQIKIVLKQNPAKMLPVGIYLVEYKKGVDKEQLAANKKLPQSSFQECPEVLLSATLTVGQPYLIIFSTFNPGEENSFDVEVFSTKDLHGFKGIR